MDLRDWHGSVYAAAAYSVSVAAVAVAVVCCYGCSYEIQSISNGHDCLTPSPGTVHNGAIAYVM